MGIKVFLFVFFSTALMQACGYNCFKTVNNNNFCEYGWCLCDRYYYGTYCQMYAPEAILYPPTVQYPYGSMWLHAHYSYDYTGFPKTLSGRNYTAISFWGVHIFNEFGGSVGPNGILTAPSFFGDITGDIFGNYDLVYAIADNGMNATTEQATPPPNPTEDCMYLRAGTQELNAITYVMSGPITVGIGDVVNFMVMQDPFAHDSYDSNYGWFKLRGPDLTCWGKLENSSTICNGSQYCAFLDDCRNCSSALRYGQNCSKFICNGIRAENTSVCNGRGVCGSNNSCVCNTGYLGQFCQEWSCNGTARTSPSVCSSHGTCTSLNTCTCAPLGFYSGTYCQTWSCFGILNSNLLTCNGNGGCIGFNNCSCRPDYIGQFCCLPGYLGNLCQLWTCSGILSTNPSVCSWHGDCPSPENCSCDAGFYGSNCQDWNCSSIPDHFSIVCNTHGSCLSPNNCSCYYPYYGSNCEEWNCSGINVDFPVVCSAHGICSSPNNCSCEPGYYGNECQDWNCTGIDTECNEGVCVSPNNCSCNEGYFGQSCEFWTCTNISIQNSSVCSFHGECLSYNNCSCLIGYFGTDCENWNCGNVSTFEPLVCSGYGNCSAPENCSCSFGYFGNLCDSWNCDGILFRNSSVCNGRGECLRPNNCSYPNNDDPPLQWDGIFIGIAFGAIYIILLLFVLMIYITNR